MPTPILISAGYGAAGNAPIPRVIFGPTTIGAGKLWIVLLNPATRQADVYLSLDGGQTWTVVAAGTGPTTVDLFAAVYDGITGIIVAAGPQDVSPFHLWTFDTVAQTWSGSFASSGGEKANSLNTIHRRSDGTLVLDYIGFPATTRTKYGVWNGAAWTFAFLDTNKIAGLFATGFLNSVLDSNDVVHTFCNFTNGVASEFLYQAIKADGTLGHFANFDNITFPTIATFAETGVPSVSDANDYVVFPVLLNPGGAPNNGNPAIFVGTPRSNPVWTLSGPLSGTLINQLGISSSIVGGITIYLDGLDVANTSILRFSTTSIAVPALGWGFVDSNAYAPLTQVFDWKVSDDPVFAPNIVLDGQHLGISLAAYSFLVGGAPPPPQPGLAVFSGVMYAGIPIGGIYSLPDPRIKCDFNGAKKCVIVKDKHGIIRSKKQGSSIAKRGF
jgi:hypothetical protein